MLSISQAFVSNQFFSVVVVVVLLTEVVFVGTVDWANVFGICFFGWDKAAADAKVNRYGFTPVSCLEKSGIFFGIKWLMSDGSTFEKTGVAVVLVVEIEDTEASEPFLGADAWAGNATAKLVRLINTRKVIAKKATIEELEFELVIVEVEIVSWDRRSRLRDKNEQK